jgi:hypothetical protein
MPLIAFSMPIWASGVGTAHPQNLGRVGRAQEAMTGFARQGTGGYGQSKFRSRHSLRNGATAALDPLRTFPKSAMISAMAENWRLRVEKRRHDGRQIALAKGSKPGATAVAHRSPSARGAQPYRQRRGFARDCTQL